MLCVGPLMLRTASFVAKVPFTDKSETVQETLQSHFIKGAKCSYGALYEWMAYRNKLHNAHATTCEMLVPFNDS